MRRAAVVLGFVSVVFLAPTAQAARPTIRQAEAAVVREARHEYGVRPIGTDYFYADCYRLTNTRFKCAWSGRTNFGGSSCTAQFNLCTFYSGKARATKYRY